MNNKSKRTQKRGIRSMSLPGSRPGAERPVAAAGAAARRRGRISRRRGWSFQGTPRLAGRADRAMLESAARRARRSPSNNVRVAGS